MVFNTGGIPMRFKVFPWIILVFFILVVIFGLPRCTQEEQFISVDWIYSREGKEVALLPSFFWLDDGTAIMFNPLEAKKEHPFWKFNPESGNRTALLNTQDAMNSLERVLSKDSMPASLERPVAFDNLGERALYQFEDDIFLLDLGSSRFFRVTDTAAGEKSPRFSPDGKKLAFVRDNDLYVYDIPSKTERRMTEDGSETLLNGTLSWVYWEEIYGRQDLGYWWSNDSSAIAFLQTDESPVSVMHFVDFKPQVPQLLTQRYPKTGGDNPVVRVGVVELGDGRLTWVDFEEHPYEYVVRVKWLSDSQQLSVQTMNRAQTELDLYFVERSKGIPVPVLKETNKGWVNVHDDLFFFEDSDRFIWASERDGFNHLYLYNLEGQPLRQITKGPWSVRNSGDPFGLQAAVSAIDEKSGWIYFTALEKSSIERHLYRITFDGAHMERMTKEDGVHAISFSKDGRYFIDHFSTRSKLPSLALYNSNGDRLSIIAPAYPGQLAKYDVQYPELFTIPAQDGFPMPAELLKPRDFDPSKKYPVIIYVYGGASVPTVLNGWRRSILFDQILLDKGFLVMGVDNRSATAISKKLENLVLHGEYGTSELSDLLDAVKWLKSQDFVDPDRIGIWGWSGGGTFTLLAMTHSKEFKAGIAVAAVTDWHYYDTKWAESFMKRPEDNPDGYAKTSLVKAAKNLHGRLLLVHGTYDDNVHPQNAWAFVDELIKANKMFDLMMYPMRQHGIADDPARIHLYSTMLEFWTKNLLE
jgi:dipeptidyl-peptidase-4